MEYYGFSLATIIVYIFVGAIASFLWYFAWMKLVNRNTELVMTSNPRMLFVLFLGGPVVWIAGFVYFLRYTRGMFQ